MTFAAINWLDISINLLLVIFVVVCLLMTLVILMQRPKQEGLGAAFGGGVTDQVFGARTTNVLQRGTVYLASMFFILSLALAILIGQKNKTISMVTPEEAEVEEVAPVVPPVEVPAPSLSEELPPETPAIETPAPDAVPADEPEATTPTVDPAPVPPAEAAPADLVPADPAPPVESAPAETAPEETPAPGEAEAAPEEP